MSSRTLVKISVLAVMAGFLGWIGLNPLHAAAAEKGSISGRIIGFDDKPVPGLALRLERFSPIGAGGRSGGLMAPSAGLGEGQHMSSGLAGRTIIGRSVTDKDGKFTFKNIDAGGATLVGGSDKIGWVYHDVTIEPNKVTDVGDIKLVKTD